MHRQRARLALTTVLAGLALDGPPPGHHTTGPDTAIFGVALLMLSVVCPLTCVTGYVLARMLARSRLVSLLIGELAALVPAA